MAIYRGPGGSGDAVVDSASEVLLVRQLAEEVQDDADAAEASKNAAATSASNASTSATNAANSATTATTQATNAANSATAASTSASNAATSATNAANSATAAQTAETNAETAETNAAASASAAATSASNAASSASSASTSATNAANSASAAATSATNASNSASAAAISETNAAASATSASNSASAASTSATNASNSASAASTSATNAAASATSASNSASTATTQATNASNSASAAATSASNAATSATNAANSASSAATSATNAANSFDAFDDRYLGNKTSAPSLDNDGNALINGALYFDTTLNIMRVYSTTGGWQSITNALASEPIRHSVRPSLLLDFANTKTLDPRITFTRGSTGTFYDGKTVAKAEENLLLRSQEFDNASWGKSNVTVTANATTAPDGTSTAESVVGNGVSTFHLINQGISALISANSYVFSVFAKANGLNFVQLHTNSSPDGRANFNITAGSGAVGTVSGAFSGATITDVGNGWYRCSAVITGSTAIFAQIALISSGTAVRAEEFSTSDGVFLWGAQLEQRSSVTAYTATTTAPITNYIPALQTAGNNVARFEHNPVTGESLGLEIEEQRTNLLLRSGDISNAVWATRSGTFTQNAAIAPDGTQTATLQVATNTDPYVYQSVVLTAQPHTLSVWIKGIGSSIGKTGTIRIANGISNQTAITGDWQRLSFTFTPAAATSNVGFEFPDMGAVANDQVLIWGAQLEAGSFATSYIPTVASQVTRSADSASMTGTNFSSWYRADEGTMYSEANAPLITGTNGVWSISDGAANNRIVSAFGSSMLFVGVGGTAQANISSGSDTAYTYAKYAGAYKVNDFAVSRNAGTVATDTSGTLPVVDRMFIGASAAGNSAYLNGTLKKLAYYPRRLTNAELQSLTTI